MQVTFWKDDEKNHCPVVAYNFSKICAIGFDCFNREFLLYPYGLTPDSVIKVCSDDFLRISVSAEDWDIGR